MKICIDAGHGGNDPGAVGGGLQEKDLVLSMAKKLAVILKACGQSVCLTRTDDSYVALSKRCSVANEWGADLFVSIHCNSSADPSAHGIETLCYTGAGRSGSVAKRVQEALVRATGWRDRGVKERTGLAVLKGTDMPAILVETGFISNETDRAFLKDASVQERLMQAVADGILGKAAEPAAKEVDRMVYHTVDELPAWGKSVILRLMQAGALQGTGNGIEVSDEMLRIFVVLDRMGILAS